MRELLKRLERLETASRPVERVRVIRQIVDARRVYAPSVATCGGDSISPAAGETVQQFEARALKHFPPKAGRIVIGSATA
jgi:hypothetical protein